MTRCYEFYCLKDDCDIIGLSSTGAKYVKRYKEAMHSHGVKFDKTPEDKELFLATQFEIGTEQALKSHDYDQRKRDREALERVWEKTNIWDFHECDARFGSAYPGRIPGQIVANALYFWCPPGGYVVDPFAGSGTTIDVCKEYGYHIKAYDLHPSREDIIKHDIRDGFPEDVVGYDFIFLDPPYGQMYKSGYKEGSLSELEYSEFLEIMYDLAQNCAKTVKPGGIVCLLIMDYLNPYLPLSVHCMNLFHKHLKLVNRVIAPLRGAQSTYTSPDEQQMINVVRDLWVFQNGS